MQESALKRPTAPSAESPTSLKSKRSAQGELAQMLNASPRVVAQRALAAQLNRGGMPEGLRSGIESLSGVSMAGVKVHYNSAKPAQLNAEAYAQGRDIHLAPGKSHHLPHEAWHVAQQAQGRVKPTMQLKKPTSAPATKSVPINDDKRLEKEADTMGKKAAMLGSVVQRAVPQTSNPPKPTANTGNAYSADNVSNFIVYSSALFGRDKMGVFKQPFRNKVLEKYVHTKSSLGDVDTVRVETGTHENAKGVALDHVTPWNTIAGHMNTRNATARLSTPYDGAAYNPGDNNNINITNTYDLYSLFDARMYYHDIDNLRPLLHSDNSASGASGTVDVRPVIDSNVAQEIATATRDWINLQTLVNMQDLAQTTPFAILSRLSPVKAAIAAATAQLKTTILKPSVAVKKKKTPKVKSKKKIQKQAPLPPTPSKKKMPPKTHPKKNAPKKKKKKPPTKKKKSKKN